MHSTSLTRQKRRRRLGVIAAGTMAVATLAAVTPTSLSIAANAEVSPALATTTTWTTASAVPHTATAVITAVHTLAAPRASSTSRAVQRAAVVAPYAFGTKAYNQWWARQIMVTKFRWTSTAQYTCLVNLWHRESHWNHTSHNAYSGAHGIPQALPGSKMASAGADWRTNPRTQIVWGLGYIKARYSTPCGAWNAFQHKGWY